MWVALIAYSGVIDWIDLLLDLTGFAFSFLLAAFAKLTFNLIQSYLYCTTSSHTLSPGILLSHLTIL